MLTPTQFIRNAALKTPMVPVAMGKVVEYSDVPLVAVPDVRCWLCGGEAGYKGQPVKKAIKPTFTNGDMARAPSSKSICPGCTFCLAPRELRNYSILATEDGLRHPTRAEVRELLLEPPPPPFLLCIAVSGQKHLHFRAEIAYSSDGFPVQYEETRVTIDRATLARLLEVVEQLYTVFTKAEILSGQYGQNRIRGFGLRRFQELEKIAGLVRGSRLFDLAVFVAQKTELEVSAQEPEKEETCTTISTQTTTLGQLALF